MKGRGDGDGVGRAVADNAEALSVRRGRPGRRRRELGAAAAGARWARPCRALETGGHQYPFVPIVPTHFGVSLLEQ